MTDTVPASGTVHWIGAGLSTGGGLAALCDSDAVRHVRVWHRTEDRAAEALAHLGLTGRAEPRAYTLPALTAELAPGDVVVSMLPAPEHAPLLAACVRGGAHFACSSYVSEAVLEHVPAAEAAGLVVLTECGLDPGIDHLFAHSLVTRAEHEIGAGTPATYRFTSYCGGIPAVPNDFRYRFSWAPAGVLGALRSPARYIEDGAETVAERPWEVTRPHGIDGETFEVYPNRDSVPFVEQYGLPAAWKARTFVRGTLRLDGWLERLGLRLRGAEGRRRRADRRPGKGVGGALPDDRRRPRPGGPRGLAGRGGGRDAEGDSDSGRRRSWSGRFSSTWRATRPRARWPAVSPARSPWGSATSSAVRCRPV